MSDSGAEMNFCRRCGSRLTNKHKHVFVCENNHTIYSNASPAVALLLFNQAGEVAVLRRAIEPGKGKLDFPGGFCDGVETVEAAVYREIEEEIGVSKQHYSQIEFVGSGIDGYEHQGEVLPVISMIFKAVCIEPVELKADDDAASAEFVPLATIKVDEIYFSSLREAYTKIMDEEVKQ